MQWPFGLVRSFEGGGNPFDWHHCTSLVRSGGELRPVVSLGPQQVYSQLFSPFSP